MFEVFRVRRIRNNEQMYKTEYRFSFIVSTISKNNIQN